MPIVGEQPRQKAAESRVVLHDEHVHRAVVGAVSERIMKTGGRCLSLA
jgi:hypothetical protein